MFLLFILACLLVLVVSLAISFSSNLQYKLSGRTTTQEYLFAHNTRTLATISNMGSILSLTTVLGLIFSSIMSYGTAAAVVLLVGALFGYFSFTQMVKIIHRPMIQAARDKGDNDHDIKVKLSLVQLVDTPAQPLMRWMQIVLYLTIMLVELTIAKLFLRELFPGSDVIIMATLGLLCFMCATYVAVGGFVGVLKTDLFQILVFFAACLLMMYFAKSDLDDLYLRAVRTIDFTASSIFNYLAVMVFVCAYCFSWPDLWVRNVGTLVFKKRMVLSTVFAAIVGIVLIVVPCIFEAVAIMDESMVGSLLTVTDTMRRVAAPLHNHAFIMHYKMGVFLLLAGGFCVLITTVDTWLVGISQYISTSARKIPVGWYRMLPFFFMAMTCSLTFFMEYGLAIFVLGLLSSLILFGNLMVIIRAAMLTRFSPSSSDALEDFRCKKILFYYFIVAGVVSLGGAFYLSPAEQYVGLLAVSQLIIGAVILLGLSIWDLKQGVRSHVKAYQKQQTP